MKYLPGLAYTLCAAACSTVAAEPDQTLSPDPQAAQDPADSPDPTSVEQSAAGVLSAPMISAAGSSTAAATPSLAGPTVSITGGTEIGSYARVLYFVSVDAPSVTAEFAVAPAAGAAFQYDLLGSGSGYSSTSRQIRLQRVPGSDALQALAATGTVTCGSLPSGTATDVTVSYTAATQTFDVLIAGAASACTNLSTNMTLPIRGFRMWDPSNAGHGGHVEFSSLALF